MTTDAPLTMIHDAETANIRHAFEATWSKLGEMLGYPFPRERIVRLARFYESGRHQWGWCYTSLLDDGWWWHITVSGKVGVMREGHESIPYASWDRKLIRNDARAYSMAELAREIEKLPDGQPGHDLTPVDLWWKDR